MKWWLWRLRPAPRKLVAEVDLKLSPFTANTFPHRASVVKEVFDAIDQAFAQNPRLKLKRDSLGRIDGNVAEGEQLGVMRTLTFTTRVTSDLPTRRVTEYRYWLTPAVLQFFDANKHLPNRDRDIGGDGTYWIQPEVFAEAGEFLSGWIEDAPRAVKVADTHKVIEMMKADGDDNPLGNAILVALDAFLEKGAPDPRFNPRKNSTPKGTDPDIDIEGGWTEADEERYQRRIAARAKRKGRKNPTTVDDVIQIAMDAVEEKKPDWFARANAILRSVNADYVGRRTKASPIVVAQCIREIEGPPQTIQTLYRIWGKSKLKSKRPREPLYVIASTSTAFRSYGETAIFQADANATEIVDAAWPMGIVGQDSGFGGGANFSVGSHNEAFQEVGITHHVPCDAVVMNPAGAGARPGRAHAGYDETRQLLAARNRRCRPSCQGWDVFDTDRGLEIEACDECNQIAMQAGQPVVFDQDVQQLPEAQAALAETEARFDVEAGAQ